MTNKVQLEFRLFVDSHSRGDIKKAKTFSVYLQ